MSNSTAPSSLGLYATLKSPETIEREREELEAQKAVLNSQNAGDDYDPEEGYFDEEESFDKLEPEVRDMIKLN